MKTTTQLTIRGFEPDLERCIRDLARREGISLNQAVLRLLRRGAGLGESPDRRDRVGSTLDDLIGTWTPGEARAVEEAAADFDRIDESLWK